MGNNCCTCVNRKDIKARKPDGDFTQRLKMDTIEMYADNSPRLNLHFDETYVLGAQ